MSSVNKAILIGRVGRDPEIRTIAASGMKVVNMTLATSRKVKGEEQTQWHRVTMYDKLAEIAAQYVRKGSLLYVEGEIKYGKFTNKDGVEQNTTDIVANQMQMIGGRPSAGEEPQRHPKEESQQSFNDDSDIPF
jgi:single-strand DNA-binding protein